MPLYSHSLGSRSSTTILLQLLNSSSNSLIPLGKVKVKDTLRRTVSQSVSLGIEPYLRLMTRYLLPLDSYTVFLWGALSDERTGLYFVFAAGPLQRSLFRDRVPWHSWSYFTVIDLRLPFSSPPTTRRVTVETRVSRFKVQVKVTLRLAVYRQSDCLSVKPLETHDQNFLSPTEPLPYYHSDKQTVVIYKASGRTVWETLSSLFEYCCVT
jgi:hypothetical protein